MSFPQGHALLIGVGTHQFAPQADVPITVADAKAVAEVLCDTAICGYPVQQVKFLHDLSATKAGILSALDDLVTHTAVGDTVFLFYCGHGALGTDGNYYLVGHDARIQAGKVVAGTGVSEGELLAKLKALNAQRVLMIFNACHSGNISPTLTIDDGVLSPSNPDADTAAALLGSGQGRIIMTACREGQVAYIGTGKLTIFTQALLDGLRGKGVPNRNGFISAFSLYEHLYDTVNEFVQNNLNAAQEPELTVLKGIGSFAVALYKGASTLGEFDAKQPVPQGMAVREVRPEKSARIFNQRVTQTGGVNFGQGNKIKIDGDVFGGDKVSGDKIDARGAQGPVFNPQAPVEQNFGGQRVDTGGGAYVGGNVTTGSGAFIGRDQINTTTTTTQGVTAADFTALIQQLRKQLTAAKLEDDEKEVIQNNIANVEAQLQKPQPKLSLIKSGLTGVKDVIEATAGVGTAALALSTLVQRAIEIAQQLFK